MIAMLSQKELLEQMKSEAIDYLDWFDGSPKTTYDITAYIIARELSNHYTGDDLTEKEAEEAITKIRQRVIPLISHFIDVDQAVSDIQRRHQ